MRGTSKGAALITVLLVMTVLSISIGSLIPVTTSVNRYTCAAEHRIRAKSYAVSGIHIVQSVIKEKTPGMFSQNLTIDKGGIELKIIREKDFFTVISSGLSGGEKYVIRRKMK